MTVVSSSIVTAVLSVCLDRPLRAQLLAAFGVRDSTDPPARWPPAGTARATLTRPGLGRRRRRWRYRRAVRQPSAQCIPQRDRCRWRRLAAKTGSSVSAAASMQSRSGAHRRPGRATSEPPVCCTAAVITGGHSEHTRGSSRWRVTRSLHSRAGKLAEYAVADMAGTQQSAATRMDWWRVIVRRYN